MKILVDMNLSPKWVDYLNRNGITAIHWPDIGDIRANDNIIIDWAAQNEYVVFTHDLDFGTILALTKRKKPSVMQVRTQNIMPEKIGKLVIDIVLQHVKILQDGALLTIDENKQRIRILPF